MGDDRKIKTLVASRFKRKLGSILFFFLFVKVLFIINTSFLVLLIFGHQIVHVTFGFSEFHFVHTFTSVPMQESFSPEHSSELFTDALEQFLDSSGVSNEGSGHFQASGWDVTNS